METLTGRPPCNGAASAAAIAVKPFRANVTRFKCAMQGGHGASSASLPTGGPDRFLRIHKWNALEAFHPAGPPLRSFQGGREVGHVVEDLSCAEVENVDSVPYAPIRVGGD